MIGPAGLVGIGTASSGAQVAGAAGVSYADLVIADGAAAYWKLNETSGSVAVDTIGTQNGTYVGGISSVAGLVDGDTAVDLSSGRYVNLGDNDAYSMATTQELTFEAWINITTLGSYNRIARKAANREMDLYINAGKLKSDVGFLTAGLDTVSAGTWYHVAFTYKRYATVNTYLNGVLQQSNSSSSPPANGTDDFLLGNPTTYPLNGLMQHVAIYPTQLTGAQILDHYTAGAGIP